MRQDLRSHENLPVQIDLTYRRCNATVTLSQLYRMGVRAIHFLWLPQRYVLYTTTRAKLHRYGGYFESFAVLGFWKINKSVALSQRYGVFRVVILSKSESVKFLLIESVICLFTDSSVKKYFSLSNHEKVRISRRIIF